MARRGGGFSTEDRALGTDRPTARRDVLHGAGLLGAAVALGGGGTTAAEEAYPPPWQGLRGSHPGSFEVAHGLRDGGAIPASAEAPLGDVVVEVASTPPAILPRSWRLAEVRPGQMRALDDLDLHLDGSWLAGLTEGVRGSVTFTARAGGASSPRPSETFASSPTTSGAGTPASPTCSPPSSSRTTPRSRPSSARPRTCSGRRASPTAWRATRRPRSSASGSRPRRSGAWSARSTSAT
jgi:hypothetical protein